MKPKRCRQGPVTDLGSMDERNLTDVFLRTAIHTTKGMGLTLSLQGNCRGVRNQIAARQTSGKSTHRINDPPGLAVCVVLYLSRGQGMGRMPPGGHIDNGRQRTVELLKTQAGTEKSDQSWGKAGHTEERSQCSAHGRKGNCLHKGRITK